MGNSRFLSALSATEYQQLTNKLWKMQSHKCFICEEEIDLELHDTNIDHIRPFVTGGKDEESNFALTHDRCNKAKQDADLEVAKRIARLDKIIKAATQKGESPSLKHVLIANGGSKYDFRFRVVGNELEYTFDKADDITKKDVKYSLMNYRVKKQHILTCRLSIFTMMMS